MDYLALRHHNSVAKLERLELLLIIIVGKNQTSTTVDLLDIINPLKITQKIISTQDYITLGNPKPKKYSFYFILNLFSGAAVVHLQLLTYITVSMHLLSTNSDPKNRKRNIYHPLWMEPT